MIPARLMPQPPALSRAPHWHALLASCAFHGGALGLLVGLAFYYDSHRPTHKGSAPGATTLTLSTLVVTAPPPPAKAAAVVAKMDLTTSASPPPLPVTAPPAPSPVKPEPESKPIAAALPVLAAKPASLPAATRQIQVIAHKVPAVPRAVIPESNHEQAAAAAPSSFAPGPSVFPHPPFPPDARDRGETGTVIMNIAFGPGGDVRAAEVARSSGVALLDDSTRAFIRTHWHSREFAGRTVSVPVEYSLETF